MIVTMRTPLDMLHHQRKVLFGEYDHITPEGSTVAAVLDAVVGAGRQPVVVDIGANCGAVARWLTRFNVPGGVVVHHYEPQTDNYGALSCNADRFNVGICNRVAVVVDEPTTGHYSLFHNGGNEGCYETVWCECDDGSHATPTVLASLLPECDILKIDCESGELGIVSQYIGAQKKAGANTPAYLCIESHSLAVVPKIIESLGSQYAPLSYVLTEGTGGQVGVLKFLRVANGA